MTNAQPAPSKNKLKQLLEQLAPDFHNLEDTSKKKPREIKALSTELSVKYKDIPCIDSRFGEISITFFAFDIASRQMEKKHHPLLSGAMTRIFKQLKQDIESGELTNEAMREINSITSDHEA